MIGEVNIATYSYIISAVHWKICSGDVKKNCEIVRKSVMSDPPRLT